MVYRFLLVEDDAQIREVICDYFSDKSEGSICMDPVRFVVTVEDNVVELAPKSMRCFAILWSIKDGA